MSAMNMPPDNRTIELISRELKVDPAFVEKDWYGVQVIAAISQMAHPGYELVFSGGTALAKAHNLLERFSEDIDFRIRPIDHSPNKSALSKLKNAVIDALSRYATKWDVPEELDNFILSHQKPHK